MWIGGTEVVHKLFHRGIVRSSRHDVAPEDSISARVKFCSAAASSDPSSSHFQWFGEERGGFEEREASRV